MTNIGKSVQMFANLFGFWEWNSQAPPLFPVLPRTNLDLSLTWWLCYRYTIELSRLKLGMGPLDKKSGALMKQSNKWPYHFRFHKNLFESESAAVWGKASWGRPVDIQNLKPTLLFWNPRTPAKLEWYPWGSLKIRIILKS